MAVTVTDRDGKERLHENAVSFSGEGGALLVRGASGRLEAVYNDPSWRSAELTELTEVSHRKPSHQDDSLPAEIALAMLNSGIRLARGVPAVMSLPLTTAEHFTVKGLSAKLVETFTADLDAPSEIPAGAKDGVAWEYPNGRSFLSFVDYDFVEVKDRLRVVIH